MRVRRAGYRIAYRLLRVWWFIARPHAIGVKCVLLDGDRVLLVRHTYGPREWQLPGGRVRRGEPPVDAARREIHEELGIEIDGWRALGQIEIRESHRHDTVHCFATELAAPPLTADGVEIATAAWFPRDALPAPISRYARRILRLV